MNKIREIPGGNHHFDEGYSLGIAVDIKIQLVGGFNLPL
jgi:hypothetical protein